jgi:hypothetical protein
MTLLQGTITIFIHSWFHFFLVPTYSENILDGQAIVTNAQQQLKNA